MKRFEIIDDKCVIPEGTKIPVTVRMLGHDVASVYVSEEIDDEDHLEEVKREQEYDVEPCDGGGELRFESTIHTNMKATTKYDIGDWVWYLRDNRAVRLDVTRVIVSIEGDGLCEVSYSLHYGDGEIPESKLFKTREELLNTL